MPDFDLDAALTPSPPPPGAGDGIDWVAQRMSDDGDEAWNDEDIEAATAGGWGLFGDGWGTFRLQALTDPEPGPVIFTTDAGAWRHVWSERAVNYVCAKALWHLRSGSPNEFAAIKRFVG